MTVNDEVEAYLAAMEARSMAALTVRNQRSHLNRFFRFLESQGLCSAHELTHAKIETYLAHLATEPSRSGEPIKPATRNVRLATIKSFCRWLAETGVVGVDPSEKVSYCRVGQKLPKGVLTVEKMKRLLAAPDPTTVLGFRDRVVLELLYSSAARVAELCGMDIGDIDMSAGLARIRNGKGNRERVVPVGRLACDLVRDYVGEIRSLILRRRADDAEEPALILSQYGRRLGTAGVARLIRRHSEAAGLSERVTPHTFRHSCATHMLRHGANVRHLQELLGHKKLTTTELYTRVTLAELKEVHARYHPRGSIEDIDVRGAQ